MGQFILLIAVFAVIIFVTIVAVISRYKRCPSDKILVVYGKIGKGPNGESRSAKCVHGGAAFIWPVFQNYSFLDLAPLSIEINLTSALSKQNIRIDVPSRFTVGISTEPGVMQNAAERLLELGLEEIQDLSKDIIFGQLRLVVATMDIEEINSNRDKFLENVSTSLEAELKKIGLRLINVNLTDIKDESGYIEALGKEAAAKAINDAKKSVAEKNRDGEIGQANALRDQRIQVAEADATAVTGENLAKVTIADSDAARREKEAEATKIAVSAEKIQAAKALEEAYKAEEMAERERSERERATKMADIIVPAEIDKQKVEIQAEAEAEKIRRHAKGDADAILAKKKAEAQGLLEVLSKQGEGFEKLVEAANANPKEAAMMMIVDQLPELIEKQVEAIKNIKIDKVTVWDSMGGSNGNGTPATANFLSGMLKSLPPLKEVFDMAGMDLPGFLEGKGNKTQNPTKTKQVKPPSKGGTEPSQ